MQTHLKLLVLFTMIMGLAMPAMATDQTFTASIKIISGFTITKQTDLTFPETQQQPGTQTVTVAPADSGAATFDIAGQAGYAITASVVESSLNLVLGSTTITVDTFTYGGSLASNGTATLDGTGNLTGAAVGASATIPGNPAVGDYAGNLTFRVVYQ